LNYFFIENQTSILPKDLTECREIFLNVCANNKNKNLWNNFLLFRKNMDKHRIEIQKKSSRGFIDNGLWYNNKQQKSKNL
jgi:hypothetical protein